MKRGDIFATKKDGELTEPIKIMRVGEFELKVTDPTENHPLSSRSGFWDVDFQDFEEDLEHGDLVPVDMNIVEKTSQ